MKKTVIRWEAGFTLVELMMVVFIVGVMAGLVVMTIGGNSARELKRDANRIQQLLVMAQDEASFSGAEIGFFLAPNQKSYGFSSFDEKKMEWHTMEKDAFVKRQLPETNQLELYVSGERVDLGKLYKDSYGKSKMLDNWLTEDDKKSTLKKQTPPALIFFSDGHYTPFRLLVKSTNVKNVVYVVEGDGLGSLRMSETDNAQKKTPKKLDAQR